MPAGRQRRTATGGTAADQAAREAYIRQRAIVYGIDPDVAVRVARSEGLNNSPTVKAARATTEHQGETSNCTLAAASATPSGARQGLIRSTRAIGRRPATSPSDRPRKAAGGPFTARRGSG